MQNPRVATKDPIRLIGMHGRFITGTSPDTNAGEVVGALWAKLNAHMDEIQRTDETVCYGYSCWGDPAERSRPDEVEYWCGIRQPEPSRDDAISEARRPQGR